MNFDIKWSLISNELIYISNEVGLKGGGSKVRSFVNNILRKRVTQKYPNVGQLFGRVFWGPRPLGADMAATPFLPPISAQQSIDYSFLSSNKIFQPNWPKNGWVMAKKRMPIYGIIIVCFF